MNKKVKASLTTLAKVAFAVGLIYWLLQGDRFDFRRLAALFEWPTFGIGFALVSLNSLLVSERWRGLLQARGFGVGFFSAIRYSMIGFFFNFVIPGGVGGDVVKSFYVAKDNPEHRLKAILTIAMDRLLGLFSMLVMALAVMIWEWSVVSSQIELLGIFKVLLLLFLAFMVGWSLIFSRRLFEWGGVQKVLGKFPKGKHILNLYENFSAYRHHKPLFFKAVVYSFIAQVISVLLFIYLGSVFGFGDIPWSQYFFVVPIGFMITAIPISPAGIGVGQMAFFFLFNLVLGKETQAGPLIISAFQIFSFCLGLGGAFFYVGSGKRPKSQTLQTQEI